MIIILIVGNLLSLLSLLSLQLFSSYYYHDYDYCQYFSYFLLIILVTRVDNIDCYYCLLRLPTMGLLFLCYHYYLTAVGVFRRPPRPELFRLLRPSTQRHGIGEIKRKCMQ